MIKVARTLFLLVIFLVSCQPPPEPAGGLSETKADQEPDAPRQLYLIAGYSQNQAPVSYSTMLYRLYEKEKLLELDRKLADGTRFIRPYHEERKVLILGDFGPISAEAYQRNESTYLLLDMDDPAEQKIFEIPYRSGEDGYALYIPGQGTFLGFRDADGIYGQNPVPFRALKMDDLQPLELPCESYNSIHVYGGAGGYDQASDRLHLNMIGDEQFSVRCIGKEFIRMGWPPLEATEMPERAIFTAMIINSEIIAGSLMIRRNKTPAGKIGSKRVFVLDRGAQRWHTVTVPGNISWFRGFDDVWLAGFVAEDWWGQPSPGKEDRPKEDRPTGPSFDGIMGLAGVYSPGILFF